ncbi:MAG: metallopeptidase family protein [Gemmatimonadota bacterium]
MDFTDFEAYARDAYEEIPDAFKAGVDGLVVRKDPVEHPDHEGVWTLGECLTEEHLSDFGSAETTRSVIALYWGSFAALAKRSRDFDWEDEIWETLTHELRHHLESLAGDDALEDVDYAAAESFKRFDGDPFDPWYYQRGDPAGPGRFRVERDLYVEIELDSDDFDRLTDVRFDVEGRRYRAPRPEELGDVHFIEVEGVGAPGDRVEVVLVRKRTWWAALLGAVVPRAPTVLESIGVGEPLDPGGYSAP